MRNCFSTLSVYNTHRTVYNVHVLQFPSILHLFLVSSGWFENSLVNVCKMYILVKMASQICLYAIFILFVIIFNDVPVQSYKTNVTTIHEQIYLFKLIDVRITWREVNVQKVAKLFLDLESRKEWYVRSKTTKPCSWLEDARRRKIKKRSSESEQIGSDKWLQKYGDADARRCFVKPFTDEFAEGTNLNSVPSNFIICNVDFFNAHSQYL